jgi:integrase
LVPGVRFWPDSEDDWQVITKALAERATLFLELNIATVRRLVEDEFADDIARQWSWRRNRYLPAHELDGLLALVARDLGLRHLDLVRVRKAHMDSWNRRLRLLPDGADVVREARRLVEGGLLVEAENYIPITGEDIIESLRVKPGPEVGRFLRRARETYRQAPCTKEELLGRLRHLLPADAQ